MGSQPKGISGSRSGACLGISEFKTPLEVWLEIMEERRPGFCEENNFEKPERVENAAIRWGLAFEIDIAQEAEYILDERIYDAEHEYTHVEHCFITCHVDGIYDYNKCLHEAKTTWIVPFRRKWGDPETDEVPRIYKHQVQHQMMLSGFDKCIISVLVFPKSTDEFEKNGILFDQIYTGGWTRVLSEMGFFHQYTIHADKKYQDTILDMYLDFWSEYILKENIPNPERYSDIKKIYKDPYGTVVATDDIFKLSSEYKSINDELKIMNKRKDYLKAKIIDGMRLSDKIIDDESEDKVILYTTDGRKLHSYNGKEFR